MKHITIDGLKGTREEVFSEIGKAGEELLNAGYKDITISTPSHTGKIFVEGH